MGVQSPSTGVFRAQPQTSSSLCRVLTSLAEADGPQVLTLLQEVLGVLRERPRTWQDCVAWALGHWQRRFHYDIKQLLSRFPPDKVGV